MRSSAQRIVLCPNGPVPDVRTPSCRQGRGTSKQSDGTAGQEEAVGALTGSGNMTAGWHATFARHERHSRERLKNAFQTSRSAPELASVHRPTKTRFSITMGEAWLVEA
jgi:hypothetical protein